MKLILLILLSIDCFTIVCICIWGAGSDNYNLKIKLLGGTLIIGVPILIINAFMDFFKCN